MGPTLEGILSLLGLGIGVFFIGIPLYKLVRALIPEKRDPVQEAKQRLEVAKADAEAARLNKEAEKVYEEIYQDVLNYDSTIENKRRV
jgi:hypothetical protein